MAKLPENNEKPAFQPDSDGRFVLLRHVPGPGFKDPGRQLPHWDLMLEHENRLVSWAFDEHPLDLLDTSLTHSLESGIAVPLVGLPTKDHRLDFLEYEGPLSRNRGLVTRHLAGTYQWLRRTPARVAVRLSFDGIVRTLEFQVGES